MAGNKIITFNYYEKGLNLYLTLQQVRTQLWFDDSDGTFKADPTTKTKDFTESTITPGVYQISENRTEWENGTYIASVFQKIGEEPNMDTDPKIGYGDVRIRGDRVVEEIQYLT